MCQSIVLLFRCFIKHSKCVRFNFVKGKERSCWPCGGYSERRAHPKRQVPHHNGINGEGDPIIAHLEARILETLPRPWA